MDLVEQKRFVQLVDGVERDILYQVTSGLVYLHNLDIIHENLKPSSIFILNQPPGSRKLQIKIAYSSSYFSTLDDLTVTKNKFLNLSWISPEMYRTGHCSEKANMFTLGCLFGYTLSGGIHPFGKDPYVRNHRIVKMESMTMTQNDLKMPYSNDHSAIKLIELMLRFEPARRPTADEVLFHHFFDCLVEFVAESGEFEG